MTPGEIAAKITIDNADANRKLEQTNAVAGLTKKTLGELATEGRKLGITLDTTSQDIRETAQATASLEARARALIEQYKTLRAMPAGQRNQAEIDRVRAELTQLAFTPGMNRGVLRGETTPGPFGGGAQQRVIIPGMQSFAAVGPVPEPAAKPPEPPTEETREYNNELMRQLGIVEALEIEIADLKLQYERTADEPSRIKIKAQLDALHLKHKELNSAPLANFRREYQQSTFAINRGMQTLSAFMLLANSVDMDQPTEGIGKYRSTIMQGTNAGLGLVMTMKMIGGTAATMAAPIGIAVGALTVFMGLLRLSKKETEGLKAGIEGFKQKQATLSMEQLPVVGANIKERLDKAKAEYEKLFIYIQSREGMIKVPTAGQAAMKRRPELEEEINTLERLQKEHKDYIQTKKDEGAVSAITADVTLGKLGTIARTQEVIKAIQEEMAKIDINSVEGKARLQAAVEKIAGAQRDIAEATKTTTERNKDQAQRQELLLELQRGSVASVREALTTMMDAKDAAGAYLLSENERLSVAVKIAGLFNTELSLLREQYLTNKMDTDEYRRKLEAMEKSAKSGRDLVLIYTELKALSAADTSRAEARMALGEATLDDIIATLTAQFKMTDASGKQLLTDEEILAIRRKILDLLTSEENARLQMIGSTDKAEITLIKNDTERARRLEEIRHAEREISIEKEYQAAITAGVDPVLAARERDAQLEAERMQNVQNRQNAEIDHLNKVTDLRIAAMANEEDQAEARYQEERKRISQSGQDAEVVKAQLNLLDKEYQDEKEQRETAHMEAVADTVGAIATALHEGLAEGAGDMVQKMLAALRIAMQIAQVVKAMNSGILAGPGGPLSIIASVLGLVGLFNQGGAVPGGSFVVKEGQAQKYGELLSALGADTVRGGIPGTDSVRKKTSAGDILLTPGERILPPEIAFIGEAINRGDLSSAQAKSMTRYIRVRQGAQPDRDLARFNGGGIVPGGYQLSSIRYAQTGDQSIVIDELQRLRSENGRLRTAVTNLKLEPVIAEVRGKVDIDNGEMFMRRHIDDSLDFRDRESI